MKTIIAILFSLCMGSLLPAQFLINPYHFATAGGATYLVNQGFEGTGYDNGETWTETGTGTLNEDYTTTVLAGSQSFNILKTSETGRVVTTFTAGDDIWIYFLFRPVSIPAAQQCVCELLNSSNTAVWRVDITAAGNLRLSAGNTVSTLSAGTTYHVWGHYVKGTGANAVQNVAFSTDGVKPTSGNNFRGITNGTPTTQASKVRIGLDGTPNTMDFIFDHVLVDDAEIGDSP